MKSKLRLVSLVLILLFFVKIIINSLSRRARIRNDKPRKYSFHNYNFILPREHSFNFTRRNSKIRDYFASRRKQLKESCENSSKLILSEEEKLLMINLEPKKKIGICRTAKHGSTTLSNIFLQQYLRL